MFHKIKTKNIPCVSKDITLGWRITKRLIPLRPQLIQLSSYPYTTSHQHVYSPYCSLYFSSGANKENLFENQELLQLVIIFPILMTLLFHSEVLLYGEIRSQLLLRVKGLQRKNPFPQRGCLFTAYHPQYFIRLYSEFGRRQYIIGISIILCLIFLKPD